MKTKCAAHFEGRISSDFTEEFPLGSSHSHLVTKSLTYDIDCSNNSAQYLLPYLFSNFSFHTHTIQPQSDAFSQSEDQDTN